MGPHGSNCDECPVQLVDGKCALEFSPDYVEANYPAEYDRVHAAIASMILKEMLDSLRANPAPFGLSMN